MKFKIKETYLLLVIVIGLISLSVYTTYALFTASTTINDVVSFNATLSTDNNLIEYEMVTLSPGEVKKIEVNVNNTYSTSLYYGTWYQVVSPSDTSDIVIGVPTESANPSSGAIAKTSSITVIVGLANNSSKTAVINIGTIGSTTSNLNLPTTRSLVPAGFDPTVPSLVINSLKINGTETTTFPINTGSYTVNTTCSDASITFNQETHKYEISNISKSKNATCGFTYTTKSNTTNLNDYLISLAGTTQGTGQLVNEVDDYKKVAEPGSSLDDATGVVAPTDYQNYSEYSSTSYSSTSGTTTSGIFTNSNNVWSSNTANMTSGTYYHFSFNVPSEGYYQICYLYGSGNTGNIIYIYNGNTQVEQLKANGGSMSTGKSSVGCVDIGRVSSSDKVRVVQKVGSMKSNLSFKMGTLSVITTTYDTGYRYEGKDPNNYIFFNNETWRIIGVFGSTSHGVSNKNLVKIIRNDSIGGYAWDKSKFNDWPNSSLYHLINDYYYTATDGTDSGYCYQDSTTITGNCDYTETGLQLDYRKMVQSVTWYLGGPSAITNPASTYYANERDSSMKYYGSASTTGNVGLMYASDYGYSVLSSSCTRTIELSSYKTNACAGNAWLTKGNDEWTITAYAKGRYTVYKIYGGAYISDNNAGNSGTFRPVLYLKSNVKYISGTGTKSDPYIIDL